MGGFEGSVVIFPLISLLFLGRKGQGEGECPFRESKGARDGALKRRRAGDARGRRAGKITAHHKNHTNHSSKKHLTSKTPLTTQTSVVLSESDRRIDTVLRRRVQTPDPNGRRDTYVRKLRQNGDESTAIHRAEPQRLHVLWRRPSSDRKSGARPRGSVPKRGRPSSRSATHQSCVAQRASKASLPAIAPFENRRGREALFTLPFPRGDSEGFRGGCPAKGRETRVEPTDVYSCPPQEGGYSAREAPKADPRKTAYSESEPVFPFRESKGARTSEASARGMLSPIPCPRSGDAGRVWNTDASGLTPALRSI